MIKNVYRSSCKVPVIIASQFNETWIFSQDFPKLLKYRISRKSVLVGAELLHAHGRTDMTNPTVAFRNFENAANTVTLFYCVL